MSKKKNNQAFRSWLLIATIAFLFFSMYRLNPNQPKVKELSQYEFYQALEHLGVRENALAVFKDFLGQQNFLFSQQLCHGCKGKYTALGIQQG